MSFAHKLLDLFKQSSYKVGYLAISVLVVHLSYNDFKEGFSIPRSNPDLSVWRNNTAMASTRPATSALLAADLKLPSYQAFIASLGISQPSARILASLLPSVTDQIRSDV